MCRMSKKYGKNISLYSVVSAVSYLVRQFCFPNPFDSFNWFFSNVFNWIFGFILFPVSFFIVGLIYIKGECPWLGSVAYCTVYFIIDLFVLGFIKEGNVWWMWLLLSLTIVVLVLLIVWRIIRQIKKPR